MRVPRGAFVTALVLGVVLVAVGGRYGYHRDELYFIEAGHHLAPGQPDQPVLVPILAAAWHAVVGGHLWAFRILPAVAAALTTVIASLTCRELGGSNRHQVAAAVVTAVTSIVPGTGHLFSTTTFDLLGTATTIWLLIRALQNPRLSSWLLVGLAAGITAEVKVLVLTVLAACAVGIVVTGRRRALLAPGPWLAAALAVLLAAPFLLWQASHGWPMNEVAASVAAGGSTSSAERATVIPLSFLMVGPFVSIPFVLGLVHLWRRPHLRWLTIAYAVFLAFVVVSGGKAYYPAGFFPAVLAAGVMPALDWLDARHRTRLAAVALAVVSIPTAFFSLPLAPPGSPVFEVATAVNPDTGETVGWPAYVDTIREVSRALPDRGNAIVLARNYGEAGAISLARRQSDADRELLPPAYSGHNGYAEWGPPPPVATTAIVIGFWPEPELASTFETCTITARLESPADIDNEEDGAPVRLCRGLVRPWSQSWGDLTRLA
ncbi:MULTISPECIES: glycosyltransferase family 39 protein [unclassified Knoellia]|uniref:glycosyltransferase family 39 protein n=1 Tax=Knoellia altitudinis TaxID=3404795 RepID=UPI00361417AD